MPNAALKPCTYPGCIVLVPTGRCDTHRQAEVVYRDPERSRLYNQAYWKQARAIQLANYPWCAKCLEKGIYTEATDVHHVKRHKGDEMTFRTSPLESLCHACHSAETAKEVNSDL